jgi:hypothetical protein
MRASLRSSISVFLNWKFSSCFWRLCLMSRRFPLFGPSGLGSGVRNPPPPPPTLQISNTFSPPVTTAVLPQSQLGHTRRDAASGQPPGLARSPLAHALTPRTRTHLHVNRFAARQATAVLGVLAAARVSARPPLPPVPRVFAMVAAAESASCCRPAP